MITSKRTESWMRFAYKLISQSEFPSYKMACVATKGGRPIGFGINKISPGILKDKRYAYCSLHCELDLKNSIGKGALKGSTIYVAGITIAGNIVKSKPCKHCQPMLIEEGVRNVFYYEQDGSISLWKVQKI